MQKLFESGYYSKTSIDTDEIPNAETTIENVCMEENVSVEDMSTEDSDEEIIMCDGKQCDQWKQIPGSKWYVCPHNNLEASQPELVPEWDPDNERQMSDYLPGSHKSVKWICSQAECECHKWTAPIYHRTRSFNPTGCPFCKGKPCEHINLETLRPDLVNQWHSDNPLPMSSYSVSSGHKAIWKCKNQHVWTAAIKNRTGKRANDCPFCSNQKIDAGNNLEVARPDLKKEWHPANPPMDSFALHSGERVKWRCNNIKQHVWTAAISDRTGKRATGCPHCAKSRGYSASQIEWLTEIEEREGIYIQHALKPEGEYKIPNVGKVDGYCKETTTIFEFHGSYWHGDPKVFDHNDIHPIRKKSYGELYANTMKRDQQIRDLGYKLVIKWESDASKEDSLIDINPSNLSDSDSGQSDEPKKIVRNAKKSANKKPSCDTKPKKNIVRVCKVNK